MRILISSCENPLPVRMSIVLQKCDSIKTRPATVHLLPCKVHCTCEHDELARCSHLAEVDKYFNPVIRNSNDPGEESGPRSAYTATFRGRPLVGTLVEMPDGYTGAVVQDKSQSSAPDMKRQFRMGSSFDQFYYWKLQNHPMPDDKLFQAFQYADLAETLHQPIPNDSTTVPAAKQD